MSYVGSKTFVDEPIVDLRFDLVLDPGLPEGGSFHFYFPGVQMQVYRWHSNFECMLLIDAVGWPGKGYVNRDQE